MSRTQMHTLGIILASALTTMGIRFLPFALFRAHTPKAVLYLGRALPCAIMAMLVVYCLKNVTLFTGSHGLPELIAVAAVVFLHKWKHNSRLSIGLGTILYMLLIQKFF